ncbi:MULTISPECIES: helix-turn-helix transcriptional regulator [unclassified Bartonella]|uniref:LexA family transcriptional regulator n=1 Tax=unclassified Bartonella TaxID=2645622 RepID=UPI0035D07E9C
MKPHVAKLENDDCIQRTYNKDMTISISQWLQNALSEAGLSQSELSRQLTASLGRSIDRAAVNKMLKETRDISARELLEISKLTGASIPPNHLVPLIGSVGVGGEIIAIDSGCLEEVEAPPSAPKGTVAVRVVGDSMFPAIEEGSLLFYSYHLPPEDLINNRAIIKTKCGKVYIKVLRLGKEKGKWVLSSINGKYADIVDVELEWCAPIDWIKPARI